MLMTIAGGIMAALTLVQQTDTTFAVDPAARINVSNYAGGIVVRTWTRNAVRVQASHSRRDQIIVDRAGAEVRIRSANWRRDADHFDVQIDGPDRVGVQIRSPRRPSIIDYEITVPASAPLDLGGPYTDVTAEGVNGEVSIKVNEGDVSIRGGSGRVTAQTVEGDITVRRAQGNIRLVSVDGDITLEDASGDILAETTDGEIRMVNINSSNVEAFSVDGDVWFSGTIQARGRYSFNTHDGDVTVYVPRATSARITVATFDGEFSTDFPFTLDTRRVRGHRFTFSVGSGAAEIDVEAFDGDIELRYLERRPAR